MHSDHQEKSPSHANVESPVVPGGILPRQAGPGMTPAVSPTSGNSGHHLREYSLPSRIGDDDIARLESLAVHRRKVRSAQTLYHEGEPFVFVYLVRSGTLKSSLAMADGGERVNGFYMAGELTGLDAVAYGRHASSATALEDTEVSAIPYAQLALATGNTDMQGLIARLMSREIVREHSHALLSQLRAEGRLAAFLLNLSRRLNARGYSLSEFHLRMTRADIGSYLGGMSLETVSRTFSIFQQQRLLEVNARHIHIIDRDALTRVFETHAYDDAWRKPER